MGFGKRNADATSYGMVSPMPLTEEAFSALVEAGCPTCSGKKLAIDAIVAQKLPLLGGEPYGGPSWSYKGEELVAGTYRVACAGCRAVLYEASACHRCGADGGVERALESEDTTPLPESCAQCGSEQLTAYAFVPTTIAYEGARPQKARGRTAPQDPGFHAFRIECKHCPASTHRRDPCPLCGGA